MGTSPIPPDGTQPPAAETQIFPAWVWGTARALAPIVFVIWLFGGFSADKGPPPLTDAACRADLKCWGEKGEPEANVRCREPIAKLAQFQIRWTYSWPDGRFSLYGWSDKTAGVIEYRGGKAEAQNGFGAWQPIVYTCDFNVATNTVVSVRAQPGRLD